MRNDYYFKSHCSKLFDHFTFSDKNHKYFALVFEKCGKSLYEFIKENKYRGNKQKITILTININKKLTLNF